MAGCAKVVWSLTDFLLGFLIAEVIALISEIKKQWIQLHHNTLTINEY